MALLFTTFLVNAGQITNCVHYPILFCNLKDFYEWLLFNLETIQYNKCILLICCMIVFKLNR